jgi:hypothetical protein
METMKTKERAEERGELVFRWQNILIRANTGIELGSDQDDKDKSQRRGESG